MRDISGLHGVHDDHGALHDAHDDGGHPQAVLLSLLSVSLFS